MFLYKYFWDTDVSNLDIDRHKTYIVERLLEFGDLDGLEWLDKTYQKSEIQKVIKKSGRISAKTANFFNLYYK